MVNVLLPNGAIISGHLAETEVWYFDKNISAGAHNGLHGTAEFLQVSDMFKHLACYKKVAHSE